MMMVLHHGTPDLFPIGTRVRVADLCVHGRVDSWQQATGTIVYIVRTDGGEWIVTFGEMLERARPRRDWQPVVVMP